MNRCAILLVAALSILTGPRWSLLAAELSEPTHVEVDPIKVEIGPGGKLETMAMNSDGNLLLGISWAADGKEGPPAIVGLPRRPLPGQPRPGQPRQRPTSGPGGQLPTDPVGPREYAIKIVSPTGKVLKTLPLKDVAPTMIHCCDDGEVYVCGHQKIVHYDARGKVAHSLDFADLLGGKYKDAHASGVTADKKYFVMAFGDGFSTRATEDIIRFGRDLTDPKVIVETQFGCCSHIDLDIRDNVLLVAENSRHRINRFSLDGELQETWGRRDRTGLEGFAACCNPVNFDFGPEGVLYTAESGVGRVEKYTANGEFLGMVGYVDTTKFDNGSMMAAMSCYIPIEVGPNAERIYVMDIRANFVRVLEAKK